MEQLLVGLVTQRRKFVLELNKIVPFLPDSASLLHTFLLQGFTIEDCPMSW
jgi:hypothetical protein